MHELWSVASNWELPLGLTNKIEEEQEKLIPYYYSHSVG